MARKVDDLGRIVLPVEMRRLYGIRTGDELAISVDGDAIVLRKRFTGCALCGGVDGLRTYREKPICTACIAELGSLGATVAEPDDAGNPASDATDVAPVTVDVQVDVVTAEPVAAPAD